MYYGLASRRRRRDGSVGPRLVTTARGAVPALLALTLALATISLPAAPVPSASNESAQQLPPPASPNPYLAPLTAWHPLWGIAAVSAAGVLGWLGVLLRSRKQLERRMVRQAEALEREKVERLHAESELRDFRALYHSLMEHLPGSVFRKDLAGRYIFANSQFCRLRGWKENDVLEKNVFDFLPPAMAAEVAREDETIQQTGNFMEIEREDRTPAGGVRHIKILKGPVFDAGGKLIGTQGMITDVTEQRLAQRQLEFERSLMGFLLDNSPDHIYFKDLQSRFIKCSQHQANVFGLKHPDEALGRTDFDFFDPAHANPAFRDEQEIIRTGVPVVGKVEKEVLKDGRVRWALTTKMPLRNPTGELIGTFGISKDITAMKEAEAKLEQVHLQLLETSRLAGMAEVATSVLHNVGNILNSVNVSAALVKERLQRTGAENLARITSLLKEHEHDLAAFFTRDPRGRLVPTYLSKLSDHLLAGQKTAVAEMELLLQNIELINEIVAMQQNYAHVSGVREIVNIHSLVEDCLRMNTNSAEQHEVEIVRDLHTVPAINVEKHKILQILINLLRNANRACQESSRADKRLIVRVISDPGRLRISVTDNGIGIPPENLTRIFSHGFTTRRDGHGFGLHASALVAREIGGTLTGHSDGPGQGATFTLELPLPSGS
jgi:PAS domain S-box-containing protein